MYSEADAMKFIRKHLTYITIAMFGTSMLALMAGGWWLIFPAAVIGLHTYAFLKVYVSKFKPADWNYWYPSPEWIKASVPKMFIKLRNTGYAKADYRKDANDCDNYVCAGIVALHDLFLEDTPDSVEADIAMFAFSFRRDSGKRHRLIMIIDNEGDEWLVENYPVFDGYHDKSGMYRSLSKAERMNGEKLS